MGKFRHHPSRRSGSKTHVADFHADPNEFAPVDVCEDIEPDAGADALEEDVKATVTRFLKRRKFYVRSGSKVIHVGTICRSGAGLSQSDQKTICLHCVKLL